MLDGNRRWARAAGFEDVTEGHLAGAAHIADLLDWCTDAGVEVVTLWLLSTDNLARPAEELDPLLRHHRRRRRGAVRDRPALAAVTRSARSTCCRRRPRSR